MKLSTAKDILLPIAAMFTICPVLLVGIGWVGFTFGPLSIFFLFLGAGIAACIGLLAIWRYERGNVDLAKRRVMIAQSRVNEAERRLAALEAEQAPHPVYNVPSDFDPSADGKNP